MLEQSLETEALEYYEERERTMPGGPDTMRQLERQIMMQIIDQRWRDHLSEMDHLHDGIFLRAMGQKDPLVEWTREGYEMFGLLMGSIDYDYVKYVMHVEIVEEELGDLDQLYVSEAEAAPSGDFGTPPPITPAGDGGHGRAIAAAPVAPVAAPTRWAERAGPGDAGGDHGSGRQVGSREDGPQSPVLVRQRQEVQALPR